MSVGDLGHGDGALLWLSERCPARVTGKPDSDCSRHPLSTAAPLFENSRHFIVAHTHTHALCAHRCIKYAWGILGLFYRLPLFFCRTRNTQLLCLASSTSVEAAACARPCVQNSNLPLSFLANLLSGPLRPVLHGAIASAAPLVLA